MLVQYKTTVTLSRAGSLQTNSLGKERISQRHNKDTMCYKCALFCAEDENKSNHATTSISLGKSFVFVTQQHILCNI